jgi:hypothetical protein
VGSGGEPITITAAVHAFENYDLPNSRRLYRAIAAGTASVDDRIAAHQALARYAWRFDRDADAALRELDAGIAIATAPGELYRQRAEVERDAARWTAASADAERAIAASSGPSAGLEAELVAAQISVGEALAGAPHRPALVVARDRALRLLDRQPGRSEPSELLLDVALLLDDGPALLRAWRSYFFATDEASINQVLRAPYRTLRALADTWRARPLSDRERADLATALAQSHFHAAAARVVAPLAAKPAGSRDLAAYQQFITGIAAVDADFYPRVANGLRDYAGLYDAAIDARARTLWAALTPDEPYVEDTLFDRIRDRFGAEDYIGNTVGYHGLLLGHIIHDEPREIEQYGYRAEFRLVVIDRMISRDFTSWYGTTNVGGWGTPSTMYQVRAAYLAEPFQRLGWVTDAAQRAKLLADIAKTERDDRARCARDRYADPASVAQRIKLAASDDIYVALRARGLTGGDLALAFVSETLRLNVEATVFAHEGRHSLDQRYFKDQFAHMSDDERELRAKFSEVIFASRPKLALTGSILGARLDETAGHGLANRRFRTLLVDWMTAHTAEIPDLDPAAPLVLQLDRLTEPQLVGILRAADPMSHARP